MIRNNRTYFNDGWEFWFDYEDYKNGKDSEKVRLPHTVKELPYHYFKEEDYQTVCAYRRIFSRDEMPLALGGRQPASFFLTFEGAAHIATVYLDGEKVLTHSCGYTAFCVDLAKGFASKDTCEVVVVVDSRESNNIPPFGNVIDYMTYGGLYRNVYVESVNEGYFADAFFTYELEEYKNVHLECEVKIENHQNLTDAYLNLYLDDQLIGTGKNLEQISAFLKDIKLWDIKEPNLYSVKLNLISKIDGEDVVLDEVEETIGFRESVFKVDGYYLNGKKVLIRGLNRHQAYPYVGYAMPDSMQRYDAKLLKHKLGLNAVRTSHYPQAQSFLDECDRLGLLVFTEIPGWQHIGDAAWKDVAVENVKEMVLQYRNHPSVILWGVRVNESIDDDEFYTRTNKVAHELDKTRQTGGVRYLQKSHLLEDVYTYNDFKHDGTNDGIEKKSKVVPKEAPYLISEYNGHMFPTKNFDSELHRVDHMKRHAKVLNDIAAQDGVAGGFGWCAFDYNTHKDFGSGDRICYHGVCDMFRNPKIGASVYMAEGAEDVMLTLTSDFDMGEKPAGGNGETFIISNADSVRMYINDLFIKEYKPSMSPYKSLKHGPMEVDDYIGDQLEKNEGYSPKTAEMIKHLFLAVMTKGNHISKKDLLLGARLILFHGLTYAKGYEIYGKYIGGWGSKIKRYRFDAIKDGKVVKTVIKQPIIDYSIVAEKSAPTLKEEHSYDVMELHLRMEDEYGNILPFYNDPVTVSVSGSISLIGPEVFSLSGGMGGCYIKSTGEKGTGMVTIKDTHGKTTTVEIVCE